MLSFSIISISVGGFKILFYPYHRPFAVGREWSIINGEDGGGEARLSTYDFQVVIHEVHGEGKGSFSKYSAGEHDDKSTVTVVVVVACEILRKNHFWQRLNFPRYLRHVMCKVRVSLFFFRVKILLFFFKLQS